MSNVKPGDLARIAPPFDGVDYDHLRNRFVHVIRHYAGGEVFGGHLVRNNVGILSWVVRCPTPITTFKFGELSEFPVPDAWLRKVAGDGTSDSSEGEVKSDVGVQA